MFRLEWLYNGNKAYLELSIIINYKESYNRIVSNQLAFGF